MSRGNKLAARRTNYPDFGSRSEKVAKRIAEIENRPAIIQKDSDELIELVHDPLMPPPLR
ncbi:hypothetical protein [Pantoea dispersa]|uniref:hypothetical protein n=1 Tax=Pantoea dispersa TaxID=59814 RepID=UPI0039B586B7